MGPWSLDHSRPASPSPSTSTFSSKSSAKNAVKTTLILLERAAEASNIPALKGAVGAVLEVVKIAEKRQQNKEALDELVIYLRRLEDAMITPLLSKQNLGVLPDLEARVRRLAEELIALANEWKTLRASHRRLISLINHEDYSVEIAKLNKLIKDSLDAFSLESQIAAAIVGESTHKVVGQVVKHQLSKQIQDLPHAKASHDSISRNNAPTCFEGTRVKVFEDIGGWTNDKEGANGYALIGVAGVGKTTVAQTLAEREAENGRLAATYFFSRNEDERSKADLFFCTIAYQLAQHNEEFADRISDALRRSPDAPNKNLAGQLTKLIIEPLRDLALPASRPILIILDALDECEEQGASEILQLLLDQLTFFKILITTRPEPHILAILNAHNQHERLILHEVDNAIVEGDIRAYLEHQLSEREIQKEVPGCSWRLQERDLDALVELAGRLFIIASTADKFIKDKIQGDPQHQLEVLLRGVEMGDNLNLSPYTMLDRLYNQVLETAIPRSHSTYNIIQRFQNVVGTIIALQNPLPPTAIAGLLNVDRSSIDVALRRLQSVIVSSMEDGCPRVYHPSFPDFITTPSRCKESRFLIDLPKHHGRLANRCFEVMRRLLKRNICNTPLPDQYYENNKIDDLSLAIEKHVPPELVYACFYWAIHLSKAEPDDESLLGQLESFSLQHLLFWLEVLSLTGNTKSAYPSLVLAQKFATSQGASADLLSMLTDGQRFVMASQDIIRVSALHIYYSALPFTPSETILFKTYKNEARLSVRALQGQRKNWDPLLAALADHAAHVRSVAFTFDGARLASASEDETITLWDGVSGAHIATLRWHSGLVYCVAFTPDGETLASGSSDCTVRLWGGRTGDSLAVFEGHSDSVTCIAFPLDGRCLASGSSDQTIRLWDVVDGAVIGILEGHSNEVTSVAFAPDGKLASGSLDNTIILWDVTTLNPITTLQAHLDRVNSVAFSPDGKRLASGSDDHTVILWDVATETPLLTLDGHSSYVTCVAFAQDGCRLSSASYDQTIRLWDSVTGEHLTTLDGHSGIVYSVTFSPDGLRLASASGDNTVRLWDCASPTPIPAREGHSNSILSLSFSPDGKRLVSGSKDNTAKLWDVTTGALVATLTEHTGFVRSVTFRCDGVCFATGSVDNTVKLWDGATGEPISTLQGHSDEVDSVAFTPDGKMIASGSNDKNVILWDSETGARLSTLEGHSGVVYSVIFAPDGKQLASGSRDKSIILWDVASTSPIVTLHGHESAVWCVAFTSNGQILASGSLDETVRLWDCATGANLTTLEGHLYAIRSVSFLKGDAVLVSQSIDGDRRQWGVGETTGTGVPEGHSSQSSTPCPSSTNTPTSSTMPVQLIKATVFHPILMSSGISPVQIPICLLPFGLYIHDVASTITHIAVGIVNGELFLVDCTQVRLD